MQQEMGIPTRIDAEEHVILLAISIPIVWGLKSVVFHVFSRIVGGEEVEILSTVHMLAYTYIPYIFKGIFDVFRGLTYQPPSYEEYVYQMQNSNIFVLFFKEYNIFFWWAFILMVIALKEQYNLSKSKAFLVVLISYIIYWFIMI